MSRREVRENIFRLVFCQEFHDEAEREEQVRRYFEEAAIPDEEVWLAAITEAEQAEITEKAARIEALAADLDEKINAASKGWRTDRMGRAELAILRLAVFEMLHVDEVPVGVAINEAVELAKKYGGDDSPAFINGILGKLV